jgi:hypothetical protein
MTVTNTTACILIAFLPLACGQCGGRRLDQEESNCRWKMMKVQQFAFVDRIEALPDGNIVDIERWIERRFGDVILLSYHEMACYPLFKLTPAGKVTLEDVWGRRLVYEKPARDSNYVYRFYSVGRNGIDEGGWGDDLDVSWPVVGTPRGWPWEGPPLVWRPTETTNPTDSRP